MATVRVRLSLRALILIVLVVGGWLGWLVRGAWIQREAVAAVERGGGSVKYDWEWAAFRYLPDGQLTQPMPKPGSKPPWPEWLVARLGPDVLGDVKQVVIGPKLSSTPITDAGLAPVAGFRALQRLHLAGTTIGDAGLAHLRGLTDLARLDLSRTRVTAAGLAHLAGLKSLQTLILAGTGITDAGLAHLAGLSSLSSLNLGKTTIGDAGLESIAGLGSLTTLNLADTRVTDDGLKHLAGLKALKSLTLKGSRVTDAGLAALRAASPGVQVVQPSAVGQHR